MLEKPIYTLFIFTVVLLQLRDASAKSLVVFQGPHHSMASPTEGPTGQEKATVQASATSNEKATSARNVQPSESAFTKHESTQSNEELMSTTKVDTPTTQEPPCWKKKKEMQAFWDMYSKLGIILQDFSLPECDNEGYYKPRQCHFGGCYCVDRAGKATNSKPTYPAFLVTCPETEAILADESSQ